MTTEYFQLLYIRKIQLARLDNFFWQNSLQKLVFWILISFMFLHIFLLCCKISELPVPHFFFFIVNLGFIRLRTASCVFALFKTAFIKIREYNLFKLKPHRTVWTVWWYTEPRCDIGVFVARPNDVCCVRQCCWVPVVPTMFSDSIMQRQVSASRSVPTSFWPPVRRHDNWQLDGWHFESTLQSWCTLRFRIGMYPG